MEKVYQEIHREIIELCIAGNVKAQYELYTLYSRAMFGICMRMLNQREESEDMLQEAFTEIFDKLGTFRFESSFGSWAKRIVVNKCLNHLRRKKPDIRFESEIKDSPVTEEGPDFSELKLQVEKIKTAITKLPDGFRVIFSLFALEGYDHEEISTILGISVSTSKTQYMRAKIKLKDLIQRM